MAVFAEGYEYLRFEANVQRQYRYRLGPEDEAFLQALLATIGTRTSVLTKGTKVWRAQLGGLEPTTENQLRRQYCYRLATIPARKDEATGGLGRGGTR